jgi:hypothetical protein
VSSRYFWPEGSSNKNEHGTDTGMKHTEGEGGNPVIICATVSDPDSLTS